MPKEDEEKRNQLVMDYKATFGSPEGKRVLEHLANVCRWNDAFLPQNAISGGVDPYQCVGYMSMRIAYRNILNMVETDLMKEHKLQTDNTQEQL
jgi:hypothetical protein